MSSERMDVVEKLRFVDDDGCDFPEWEEVTLGEVVNTYNGVSGKGREDFSKDRKEGFSPFVSYQDIVNNPTVPTPTNYVKTEQKDFRAKVSVGDIVVCKTNEVGASSVMLRDYGEDVYLNSFCIGLSPKNNVCPEFLVQFLNSEKMKRGLRSITQTSTIKNLSKRNLLGFPIPLPSLPEQKKIAEFLGNIDALVNDEAEVVKLWKDRKRAWSQRIFARDARFKDGDGNEFTEWDEVALGEILEEVSEKTTENNQHEILSSTNKGLFAQSKYFNGQIASKENTGYKILRLNQIVLSPQNVWMGNINLNSDFEIGIVSPSYKTYNVRESFDPKYVGQLIQTNSMIQSFKKASYAGASVVRRTLDTIEFESIRTPLPSLPEQKKIAEFLGSLDEDVAAHERRLAALKDLKRAYSQRIFA